MTQFSTPVAVGPSTMLWRAAEPRSDRLVVINKGPGALDVPRDGAAWDQMDIFFMKNDIEAAKADPAFSGAEFVVFETDRNMRKFSIVKQVFENWPVLEQYKYVIFLDDDLVPAGCTINALFELFIETGLRVGQPALSRDSFFTHEILLQDERFRWRRTNFAEVMCPVLTREALVEYLPIFNGTISGFGIDVLWSEQEWRKVGGLAVLDATPLRHTRPVRGGIAYQGLAQAEERLEFFERHRLRNFLHLTLGGELAAPLIVEGRRIDRL